jgi:hypothetical protein
VLLLVVSASIQRQRTVEAFCGLGALTVRGVLGYCSSPSLIRTIMGEGWTGLPGNPDHRGETLWYREYAKCHHSEVHPGTGHESPEGE